MIQLKNLERSYKTAAGETWVLRRIDLTIPSGQFLTIMGPSGAGKSSLLNALALLDDQWAGEFWFHDEPVHKMKRKDRAELAKKNVGMVFQSYHLLDDLTVAENIDLPLSYKDIPRSERQAMVADTLDRFQIVAKKDLYPNQLSGGQQQLVGIARAVIHKPSLLLAAGELRRKEILLAHDVEAVQRVGDQRLALCARHVLVAQRKVNVFGNRQLVEQVIALEDHAHAALCQFSTLLASHGVHRIAIEVILA